MKQQATDDLGLVLAVVGIIGLIWLFSKE